MKIELVFDENDIEWMNEKFDIESEKDLKDAVIECINTYMEM